MIYAGLLSLLFAHYFMPTIEIAWYVGWAANMIVMSSLAFMAWLVIKPKNPGERSVLMLICFYCLIGFACQVFDTYLSHYITLGLMTIMSAFFWTIKQLLLIRYKGDKLTQDTYCYALAPIKNRWGALNILRPFVIGEYGGRLLIAGEHTYMFHRGVMKKVPTKHVKMENYVIVDTGKFIDPETNARLDKRIGQKIILCLRDCSTLDCGVSLTSLLFKRGSRDYSG